MSKSNLPEGLSEADVKLLIENPGQTIGGVVGGAPTAFKSSSSVDISKPSAKGVRPRIQGNNGHDVTQGRISRPSAALPERLAAGDAERRALEKARRDEREALIKETDPTAMAKQVAYLTRQVQKLSKELNQLKKTNG